MPERHITKIISPQGELLAEDIPFKTVREEWNEYKLADGSIIKVKVIVIKISRAFDSRTGELLRIPETGEPIYNVRNAITIAAEVAESLMKPKPAAETPQAEAPKSEPTQTEAEQK